VAASRNLYGQQWIPGERQDQVRSVLAKTQHIEQHENDCELANYKRYFQRKGGLLNRGYDAEKKLRSWWIWAR
jgi:hypothetical protein